MPPAQRQTPRSLPRPGRRLPPAGAPEIVDGVARWEGVHVAGTPPEAAEARSLAFYDCDVDGLSLARRQVALRLHDCNLSALDLANARFESLEIASCTLTGSRLVGAVLGGSLRDVSLRDCQLDLASLRMSKVARTELAGCSLREIDAYGATFDSLLCTGCDLARADLTGAAFTRSAIEGCELTALRGIEALRGVRIPLADLLEVAPLLAEALGIIATGGETGDAD